MKVTRAMIARELRFMGGVYRLLLRGTPGAMPKLRHSPTDPKRRRYNLFLDRADGSKLRVLVKRPRLGGKLPGLLWIHGGGYAVGMPEMIDFSMARHLADGCVILAPEYTLSPEKPYPAALDDCADALHYMVSHADALGIDPARIFVGGESAGGGLCAALCMRERDCGGVKIAGQLPLYPMLDDRMESESMRDNDAPVWNAAHNREAWDWYLHGKDGSRPLAEIPAYAAPARAENFDGLPHTVTFVGSIEPFRDETVSYVEALRNAGVPVDFREFAGCFHAFDMMVPWSPQAKEAAEFVRAAFHLMCLDTATAAGRGAFRNSSLDNPPEA